MNMIDIFDLLSEIKKTPISVESGGLSFSGRHPSRATSKPGSNDTRLATPRNLTLPDSPAAGVRLQLAVSATALTHAPDIHSGHVWVSRRHSPQASLPSM